MTRHEEGRHMLSSERDPREWPDSEQSGSETGGSDPSREAEELRALCQPFR
jgi:hypothetical protein